MSRRASRWFVCDRCGDEIPDWRTFGVSDRHYCLETCVPLRARFKMWLREKLGRTS